MSVFLQTKLTNPINSAETLINVQLGIAEFDDPTTGQQIALKATANGASCLFPLDDLIATVLRGKASGFAGLRTGTYLDTQYVSGVTVGVDSETGFVAKDIIAIWNNVGDPPEYRYLDSVAAGSLTINAALDNGPYHIGAYVAKVTLPSGYIRSGRGLGDEEGVLSQLERPLPLDLPTADVVDNADGTLDVTIPADPLEDAASVVDIYCRSADFTRVEPNWVPDEVNQAFAAAGVLINTFDGGADAVPSDGGGSTISAGTYYIGLVVKSASGQHDIKESRLSNVVAITLA